jgi:hypothetical protein
LRFEANISKAGAVVALRQSKHARHRLRVNASVRLPLADALEPVEPVTIRRHQQVLHRRRVATLAVTRQRLRVDGLMLTILMRVASFSIM